MRQQPAETFRLLSAFTEPAQAQDMEMMDEMQLRGARILAADDEEANLRLMRRVLERAGFTAFTTTTDPAEVVPLFDRVRPDLVVLDLHMPGMGGMEVIELLRSRLHAEGWLPVLMVSGDLTPEARHRALASGARDFLSKPYDPPEAVLRIRNLLEMRFLHRQVREQNRQLEARVAERTRELEQAQHEVLERLAQAAELRDDETGEHVRRVGDLAARIAAAMGLDAGFAERLRHAAALHDVGKIGIPDAILRKPGKLSDEERARMNTHTTIGARILAGGRSELMAMAERIARAHHERWDGAGYPHGLRGDAIPPEARIVAVADFFDALTHDRPYRRAVPVPDTLRMIAQESGRHFDPAVAEALIGCLAEA
jgi:putative two-component system response regulator